MYTALLVAHSYLRWVLLLAAVVALVRAIGGAREGRPFTPSDDRAGRLFVTLFDIQATLGLLLYLAFSPLTQAAFADMGAAMSDSVLRFFAVEHIFGMLVAIALAHVGRAKSRRGSTSAARHKAAAVYFGLALVVMLLTIPWPGMPAARPLFRF